MKQVTVKNVVIAESTTMEVFPWGWDCKALASALKVVWLENDEFKTHTFMVDERFGWDLEHTEVTIEYIENREQMVKVYEKHLLQQRIDGSKKMGHSIYAEVGDTIEVYKGRKYPKGSQFKVKGETTWKDMYGRTKAYYWITECGKKVDKFNCIIVG